MRAVVLCATAIMFIAISAVPGSRGQEQSTPSASPATTAVNAEQQKVFLFVQRTDRHAKYSSHEVFENVFSDLSDYLKTHNIAVAMDEFGGGNHSEGATPLDTIFTIASDAKATSVMSVIVDRPMTKWLKITVQCFDMNRKPLWQEEVASGGGLSGSHGFEVSTKKLHAQLDKHVGQNGLPVLSSAKEAAVEKH